MYKSLKLVINASFNDLSYMWGYHALQNALLTQRVLDNETEFVFLTHELQTDRNI